MDQKLLKEELKNKINFIVIGFTSFLAIALIPFLTSAFNESNDQEIIQQAFPDSTIGWIIWAIFRFMIVTINMCIFIAFVNQGKLNVKNNNDFVSSRNKWIEVQIYKGKHSKKGKKAVPLTPKQHYAKLYSEKGFALTIGSFASCFTITFMILQWDLATFIVIVLTVAFAVVFGFLQMAKEEYYWTNDFKVIADIEYDKMKEEMNKEKEVSEDGR